MGVARLYKAASPLNSAELREVDTVQSFDVMYLAHLNHDPLKLSRLDHTDWRFSAVAFGPTAAPPVGLAAAVVNPNQDADNGGNAYFPQPDTYVATVIMADTLQESRASDPVTATNDLTLKRNKNILTCTPVVGAERYRFYKAHNEQAYGYIGASKTPALTDDYIGQDLTLGPLEGRTPFAADGNKPSTVTFFEGRLWWGRTRNNPNAIYSSRSSDFENMDVSVPTRPDDAISIRLVAQGVNQANHLVPMANLYIFSSDGLFKIEGANEDYISASPPPRQRPASARGSSRLRPLVVDSTAFYKTSSSSAVRSAGYNFEVNGVKSDDVSIFSPHFFEGFDIVAWCFAEEPLSVVWAARSDGTLLAFTWVKEHDVWGWTICPLAGGTLVRSLCSVRESGEDRVYGIFESTIAGVTRKWRGRLASGRAIVDGVRPAFHWACHLDCAITRVYDAPTNVIDQLWHLEGETVAAFADGIEYEDLVVANGRTRLPEGATCLIAHVGFPFDAIAETLPLNFPTTQGPNVGKAQQTGLAMIKMVKSRGVRVGVKASAIRAIKPRAQFVDLTTEASLMTGDFEVATDPVVRFSATAFIKQRISPMTITAVYLEAKVTGG